MSKETLLKFFENWKSGTIRNYYRSEPVPSKKEESKGNFVILYGENFNKFVYRPDKDVVVFFYSIWCLECEEIQLLF